MRLLSPVPGRQTRRYPLPSVTRGELVAMPVMLARLLPRVMSPTLPEACHVRRPESASTAVRSAA